MRQEFLETRPRAADPGRAMGEQKVVEFAFAQVPEKDRAQAVLDAFGVVAHVGVGYETEPSVRAHDGVSDAQDAAVQGQVERRFFRTQGTDLQRQHAAGQRPAVAEARDRLAVGEFVQSVRVAPDCAP